MSADGIFGRAREREVLDAVVQRDNGGFAALVVTGEPGIGRTVLLDDAVGRARARGMRVLYAAPAHAEADLPFVSVYDLVSAVDATELELWPVLTGATRHDAGMDLTAPAVSRVVGPALHALICALAATGPVLVAVDDVHLLDRGSARALAFALRRLRREPVAFIGAAPTLAAVPGGLARAWAPRAAEICEVGPLQEPALTGLLRSRFPTARDLPSEALRHLHAIARGNPSVAAAILDETRDRGAPLTRPDRWPLPAPLAASALGRLADLPAGTRALLTACAVMFRADVAAAARATRLSADDLAPALAEGIARVSGDRLAFADPALASALYAAAADEERHQLHVRLARTGGNALERALHVALLTVAPDAGTASLLEANAWRAGSRGAPATAAVLAAAAARLTPDLDGSAARARWRAAAAYHVRAGDLRLANRLLERVACQVHTGAERASSLAALGRVRASLGHLTQAQVLMEVAMGDTDDDEIRSVIHRDLAWTSALMGEQQRARRHARAVAELAGGSGAPGAVAAAQATAAMPTLSPSNGPMGSAAPVPAGDANEPPLLCRPRLAQALWDLRTGNLARADAALRAAERDLVLSGEVGATPLVWVMAAELHCVLGTWRQADLYAQDAVDSASSSGLAMLLPWALSARALVDAHRGDVAAARGAAAEGLEAAVMMSAGSLATLNQAVLGFLELSVDNAAGAYRRLEPLTAELDADLDPGLCPWVADAVEALVALKRVDEADRLLTPFEERALALGRPLQELAAARCRGRLLAADGRRPAAIGHVTATLERLARVPAPFDQARTRLVVGRLLRRDRRPQEAQAALARAADAFDELGARLWAARARTELAATGPATAGPFTAVEQAVVDLVTKGHSTGEMAALLYVSTRTVEAHLSSIYRKAGVRGRGQLVYHLACEPVSSPF